MKKIKMLTSQEYRSALITTLDEFDRFCRTNKLRYFLIGGTLLGAIRHKGFIPWDDDIDVGMPQEDYDKFRKIYRDNDKFSFFDCMKNREYYLPYGKLCLNSVVLHENLNTKMLIGAYIDVFPFNFIKREKLKGLKKFMKYDSFSKKLINLKYVSTEGKTFFKKIIISICHLIYPFSLNHISKKKIKNSKEFVSEQQTLLYGNVFGVWGIKEITDFANFKESIEVEFEGKKYFAPIGYDSYLKGLYNDYMSMPPVEKRISHHAFVAYWRD